MKNKKSITGIAVFTAFLMLSSMVFVSPVSAQIPYNPNVKGIEGELTQTMDEPEDSIGSSLAEVTDTNEITLLLEQITNNIEVQELMDQIQNTEDSEEQYMLMEQLVELIQSLPEYRQLENIVGESTDATGLNNDIDQYMQMLLAYLETSTDMTSSEEIQTDQATSFVTENTNNFDIVGVPLMIPTEFMVEYHDTYYPDEDTGIPDPNNPDETLTWAELLDLLESGEITVEDILEQGFTLEDIAGYLMIGGLFLIYAGQGLVFGGVISELVGIFVGEYTPFTGDFWQNLGNNLFSLGYFIAFVGVGSMVLGLVLASLFNESE